MHKIKHKSRGALVGELSALTLAIAAMAPMPAALSPFGGVTVALAQPTNPCAPKRPTKAKPANPCAPQKAPPVNPCAPQKAPPVNPCAPQKAPPVNPCAPQKARPVNPCAPQEVGSKAAETQAAVKAAKAKKAKKDCTGPVNPCAPARDCSKDDQG